VLVLVCCVLASCAPSDHGRSATDLGRDVYERAGFRLGGAGEVGDFSAVASPDGLTEDRAVDLALVNNAAFQEQLADLGLAQADLIQAGLIANPDALLLIPVGPKQLEATITAPLEALWLRGRRTEAARLSSDRAATRLTQVALDLIRDVRLAYADVALARRRVALFEESSKLRDRAATIAQSRLRAGEGIPLDSLTARIDVIRADQEARSLAFAATIAEERLRALIGAGAVRTPLNVTAVSDVPAAGDWDVDALVNAAVTDRADVRSAELGVTAARLRARLARIDWLNFSFVADANERGSKGFEAGPGVRFTLPIFNQNQGLIARADAELDRAVRQQRTLRDRVILEVREAHARLAQAREDLVAVRTRVLPALEEAVQLAERSYRGGETQLVMVVETNRQLLDARIREAQSASDLRRARAELERSVGRRLESAAPPTPATRPATQTTERRP
jgi:cobalt-zinc-cadmium efflux system outer membrane protein